MTGSIAYTRSSTRLPQTLGSNPIPLHSRPAPTLKHNHESIIFWFKCRSNVLHMSIC